MILSDLPSSAEAGFAKAGNRFPPSDQVRGQAFSGSCSSEQLCRSPRASAHDGLIQHRQKRRAVAAQMLLNDNDWFSYSAASTACVSSATSATIWSCRSGMTPGSDFNAEMVRGFGNSAAFPAPRLPHKAPELHGHCARRRRHHRRPRSSREDRETRCRWPSPAPASSTMAT